MSNKIARDDPGNLVPVMGLLSAGGQAVAYTATSARSTALTAGDRTGAFASVYATTDCFIEVGDSSVTANTTTSHFLAAGERRDLYFPTASLYVAAIQASAGGTLYVSQYDGAI